MGLVFTAVTGELPMVRRVWSASCDASTGFTSAVKASSMIAFARTEAGVTVHVGSKASRPATVVVASPVIKGGGEPLFRSSSTGTAELLDTRTFATGAVVHAYRPLPPPDPSRR